MSRIASTVALIAASSLLSPPQLSYAAPKAATSASAKPKAKAQSKTKAKPTDTIRAQALSYEEVEYEKGVTYFKAGDYERAVIAFVKERIASTPAGPSSTAKMLSASRSPSRSKKTAPGVKVSMNSIRPSA